jgi:Ca2+-dependent lipid-binding protein
MHDSILTVNVVEAKNLKPMDYGVSSDPYCILTCEGQSAKTHTVPNELNPVWNEVYSFKIVTGEDPLQVVVMD